jgi:hypothetical protein
MPQRTLTEFERDEAEQVFMTSVDLDAVRILESDWLALKIETVGSRFARRPPRDTNAVTFGRLIRFSRQLKLGEENSERARIDDMAWLVHELTHVWQYQHFGWVYLPQAVGAQLREGPSAYQYSEQISLADRGADLEQMWQAGKRLADFNREQQGDIARDYYKALKAESNTSGWLHFIEEIRGAS